MLIALALKLKYLKKSYVRTRIMFSSLSLTVSQFAAILKSTIKGCFCWTKICHNARLSKREKE